MRILFYLPVITPWWFESVVVPLIERLAVGNDVHVLAPVPWLGTGIGPCELGACAHLPQVQWHIVESDVHPTMRTEPVERAGIIAFVRSLAPDYVLCRSADCETVRAFPGVVRHMMEGGAAPLSIPNDWIVLQEQPLDHGLLPELSSYEIDHLERLIAPVWSSLLEAADASLRMREAFHNWAGLPHDRPILALPLEYEHEENFFSMHRIGGASNAKLIEELDDRIHDSFFLAVTNHPLNEKHVDNSALEAVIASRSSRMRLIPSVAPDETSSTMTLARDADGMLLGDSKVFSMAAFHGTPILRRSRFRSGAWLNAYADPENFLPAVAEHRAARPDDALARVWFALHIANDVLDPNDPGLTGGDLLARLDRPVDPARWERGFARFSAASGLRQ